MRLFTAVLFAGLTLVGAAQAQIFGPDSTFEEMIANPKARAILDANIPLVMTVFDGGSGRPETATLKSVSENEQAQTMGGFSPEAYAKILREFAALPAGSPAAGPKFGPNSTFKELAANARAKAIIEAHAPIVMSAFESGVFPETATLKNIAEEPVAQTQAGFTAEVYAKVLAELDRL